MIVTLAIRLQLIPAVAAIFLSALAGRRVFGVRIALARARRIRRTTRTVRQLRSTAFLSSTLLLQVSCNSCGPCRVLVALIWRRAAREPGTINLMCIVCAPTGALLRPLAIVRNADFHPRRSNANRRALDARSAAGKTRTLASLLAPASARIVATNQTVCDLHRKPLVPTTVHAGS